MPGHLAPHDTRAVMARADYADTERVKAALSTVSQDSEFKALVLNSSSNPSNFVFKSVTVSSGSACKGCVRGLVCATACDRRP